MESSKAGRLKVSPQSQVSARTRNETEAVGKSAQMAYISRNVWVFQGGVFESVGLALFGVP